MSRDKSDLDVSHMVGIIYIESICMCWQVTIDKVSSVPNIFNQLLLIICNICSMGMLDHIYRTSSIWGVLGRTLALLLGECIVTRRCMQIDSIN